MDNDKDPQNPTPNQNENQSIQTSNNGNYNQYIDPDYQKKQKKKKLLLIASLVAGILTIIIIVALAALSLSSSSDNTNEDNSVNVTQICEDEECFDESFIQCEQAVYLNELDVNSDFSEEYTILGPENDSCLVSYKSIEQTEDEQIIEATVCSVDSSKKFLLALTEALDNPEEHSCSGSGQEG